MRSIVLALSEDCIAGSGTIVGLAGTELRPTSSLKVTMSRKSRFKVSLYAIRASSSDLVLSAICATYPRGSARLRSSLDIQLVHCHLSEINGRTKPLRGEC